MLKLVKSFNDATVYVPKTPYYEANLLFLNIKLRLFKF
jgi:hypothetical protein